ncbi:MAG: GNAT family N-acetyltransferase [Bacteroidota bacterium]
MDVFPSLKTGRLHLRRLEPEDLPQLVQHANNRKVTDNLANLSFPYREPDAAFRIGYVLKGFKEKTRFVFAITLLENGAFIGEISLHLTDPGRRHAQLAYWVGEPFWRQGFATEAATAVIEFGFTKANYALIYADCKPSNLASQRVMRKSGMKLHEDRIHQLVFKIEPPMQNDVP